MSLVRLLVAHGVQVDAHDDNEDTALLCACRMGHAEAARALEEAEQARRQFEEEAELERNRYDCSLYLFFVNGGP